MGIRKDLVGQMFGKWRVLDFDYEKGKWKCECQCELKTIKYHLSHTLTSGMTHECQEGIKSKIDSNFFNVIDTQEKAYILGLLTADGCNYEKDGRVKIDLVEEDVHILNSIKDALKYEGNIKTYYAKDKKFGDKYYKAKPICRLFISDKNISKQLAIKGCIANKSKILTFPSTEHVPEYLYNHYIRGYFDGNGYIGCWVDNKNTGHKKFNMDFNGSYEFVKFISDYISKEFNCTPNLQRRFPDRDNNNLTIKLCGNRVIQRVTDWMYKDATIYLNRKYEKYVELLEMNKG